MAQKNENMAQRISSIFQNIFDKMGQSNGFRKIKDELSVTERKQGFDQLIAKVQKNKATQEAKVNKDNTPKPK